MSVPVTLKVYKGDQLIATQEYEREIIKIGRLSSAHLRLDDEKVSRIHSVIEVSSSGELSIVDMGSAEGTYVNGKRVNKGPISGGDEIKVGGTLIRVGVGGAASNLAAAAASTDLSAEEPTLSSAAMALRTLVLMRARSALDSPPNIAIIRSCASESGSTRPPTSGTHSSTP